MVLSRRKFLIGSGTLAAATTLRPGNLLAALERQTLNPPATPATSRPTNINGRWVRRSVSIGRSGARGWQSASAS